MYRQQEACGRQQLAHCAAWHLSAPFVPHSQWGSHMTGEQVVAPSTCHDRVQAAVVHAVALHHAHPGSCIKHTKRSRFGCGLVATEAGIAAAGAAQAAATRLCMHVHRMMPLTTTFTRNVTYASLTISVIDKEAQSTELSIERHHVQIAVQPLMPHTLFTNPTSYTLLINIS